VSNQKILSKRHPAFFGKIMKIEALAKLFPVKKGYSEADINFELEDEVFYIEKNALTSRELHLFTDVLFPEMTTSFNQLTSGTYRLIQLKSDNFDEIAENLSLILPEIVRVKKTALDEGFAVGKMSADRLSESEIKNVLGTLAQDLGVRCDYYLGLFADKTELDALYQTEKRNFEQGLTFSEALIKTGLDTIASAPLTKIKQKLLTDFEAQDLICHLYKNDGNQLKTAKAMYIHRNTLTQKIKKFEKQYDLTLVGSDLVLLYSLI
jgi:DNA-binding protein Fis